MESGKRTLNKKKHVFRVEIMVDESTPTLALAALLQALNHPNVDDFRITEGIQFGKLLESTVQNGTAQPIAIPAHSAIPAKHAVNAQQKEQKDKAPAKPEPPQPAANRKKTALPAPEAGTLSLENLLHLQESGALVRLVAVKSKGVKLSIPCRILNFDAPGQQLTIYHVDEKKVYSFSLNEIEDLIL